MLDAVIKSAILFAAVAIVTRLLQRSAASVRHLLWSFAIAGAVMIPLLSRVAPFKLPVLPRSPAVAASGAAERFSLDETDASISTSASATPSASTEVEPHAATDRAPAPVGSPQASSAGALGRNIPWLTLFAALWVAGALVMLARLVAGFVTVHRIAGRAREITDPDWRNAIDRAVVSIGVRVPVEVRFSDEMPMPFTCGLLRPVVVLPTSANDWTAEQRDAVLLHEMAHISRGDLPMNVLSHVMRAMYWVNPLAWVAAHRLRAEGERACDDTVLRAGARPSDYADHLLSIIRTVGRPIPNVALAMARGSDFEGRLLAILEPGVSRGRLGRARTAGVATVFLAALMPLSAMTSARVVSDSTEPVAGTAPDIAVQTESSAPAVTAALPQASGAVAALGEALRDTDASVRLAAVNSLGALQDPTAIAALARALKEDTDARVREAAAWALGEIDDNRAVPHLLEALKAERSPRVREKIIDALAEIDDASAIAGVSAVLKDPTPAVRRAAVSALAAFEDPAAAGALISMIRDEDVEVRRRVAEALGELEASNAIEALTSMTRDADAEVRANALEALHNSEDMKLVPVFVAALKDSSSHVREQAAEALGSFDELKTAPRALIDALTDASRGVRRQAAEALGNIGDEAAVPALRKLVGDSDAETRRTAVHALKDVGGAEAMQALLALLKDQDPEVRRIAAEALGRKR